MASRKSIEAGGRGRTRPLLATAVETLAAVSGVDETVVDVVHGRALRHYQEGLRQYFAIRLRSVEAAAAALAELRARVAMLPAEALVEPPGIRARLYALARAITAARGTPSNGAAGGSLPWRIPPDGTIPVRALSRLRTELAERDAELLELRWARELHLEEIAHVLGEPVDVIREALGAAGERARSIVGEAATGEGLPRIALEAFALERGPESEEHAEEEPPPLPEGTVIGERYAIAHRVGSGAFGDVYRADDTEVPGHVVALKLLRKPSLSVESRASARRELHLIASVFHPSVVQFKDHGWYEDRLWFVMPWYDGETLEARIARQPLTRVEARRIFEPLARALATMHAAGIRHQDIKPDNIMLARIRGFGYEPGDDEILPVLLDLGVAAKDAEMVIAGTPNYFAPEVAAQFASIEAKRPITAAADVFSFSLALRNALEPATQEDVPAGAVESFIERRARSLPPLPKGRDLAYLEPFFRRWLSLDPAERPTPDELAEELEVLTRPEERRARFISALRWLGPLVLALGVVFLSVVYVLNERAERQRIEATRAKMTASGLREDLELSREQRRILERDVETIRERYESGQMTRQELTTKLARTEGQLRLTRGRIAVLESEGEEREGALAREKDRLRELMGELHAIEIELSRAESQREAAQERVAGLEQELERMRVEVKEAHQAGDRDRRRVAELEAEMAQTRSRLESEQARAARLERDLGRVRDAQARAREARPTRLDGESGPPPLADTE